MGSGIRGCCCCHAITIQARQRRAVSLTTSCGKAILVFVAAALILFVCPEYGIQHTSETAHILTVAVGVFVVLIPILVLLPILLPGRPLTGGSEERLLFRTYREWVSVNIGIAMLALAFWSQFHEVRIFYLPSRAITGTIGAVLMIYGFLAEPLGLIRNAVDFGRAQQAQMVG